MQIPGSFRQFFPDAVTMDRRERARSVLGAVLGVFVTGLLCQQMLGGATMFWLIAPMGASAVLIFAAPASPFAQPWPVLGGNMVSALAGIACGKLIAWPLAAAVVALGLAIILMIALRCLHPPGGAVALGTALGGTAVAELGWLYPLSPVGLNTLVLLLAGVAYNRMCGRRYPHMASPHARLPNADQLPGSPIGITHEDLDAVLRQYNQMLDISRDDLEEIFIRTQLHAHHRRFGELSCADVMSRDTTAVHFGTSLQEAWQLLQQRPRHSLPVVDRFNHVIGMVAISDFVEHASPRAVSRLGPRLDRLLRRTRSPYSEKPEVVGQIMQKNIRIASGSESLTSLAGLFSSGEQTFVPVTGENRKLEGFLTQSAFVNALYTAQLDAQPEVRPVQPAAQPAATAA